MFRDNDCVSSIFLYKELLMPRLIILLFNLFQLIFLIFCLVKVSFKNVGRDIFEYVRSLSNKKVFVKRKRGEQDFLFFN